MLRSVKILSIKKILALSLSLTFFAGSSQTFELDPVNKKDTINIIDFKGMKQKHWVVFGRNKPDTCFAKTSRVEDGFYGDNRKKGIWTSFFCSGNVYKKITFQNGRPDGYAIIFHENGKTAEEGTWKGNKWSGPYKNYYDNGQVQQEFTFNQAGKREGVQKYYYSDGTKQIEGNWQNGKENGVVTEYHPDGSVKKTVDYTNGNADVASIKEFKPKKPVITTEEVASTKKVVASKEETVPGDTKTPTMLNGYHVLFNKDRQKTKDGTFKDNRLMEGKNYIYDKNGILTEIEIYKNGVFVGTTQPD
ncbi:MAG TPA: toxin-antitoxin system YwqK family antitoxin [Bacteroidia bacterium]|jgi:antitoxin component YwqK of YwqJK toxin-antitoxin module|nr:toxin-antitoxin system YwqK family antitoxin [Bacteroidia bacterium]